MADYVLRLTREENIVLGAATVRRLIEGRDGSAALLYLCLQIEKPSAEALRARLGWSEAELSAAAGRLRALGLLQEPPEGAPPSAPSAPETALPDYSREDVMNTLERDGSFAAVLHEYERKLGRLSEPSVKKLLGLYDYLGFPADVLALLLQYCAERKAARFGAEKPPTMREIEKVGYDWARRELFTSEAADAHIRRERERRTRFGAYMAVLGLGDRAPVASEEKYLGNWLDWGFPPETVAIAHDKTVLNCHEFKWAYCNGILRRWHEKRLHTPDEARSETNSRRARPSDSGDRNAWMDEFIR